MQRIFMVCCLCLSLWRPAYADPVHIRAGKLIDVEAGQVLNDQRITIEGAHIQSIAPWDNPQNGQIMDWSNFSVLPGLSDVHTHLLGPIQSDNIAEPLLTSAAQDVLIGARHAKATLMAGFTLVRDVGSWRALSDVALRDAIAAGDILGPRMRVAGAYVTQSGGAGDLTGIAGDVILPAEMRFGVADTPEEVRKRVRALINGGVDFIKIMATGAVLTVNTTPGLPEFDEASLRAAVDEAHKYNRDVTAHAHGTQGVKNAIRAGVRSIEHGSFLDDEAIAMMKAKGVWLVADIYNGDYIESVGRREGWPEETLLKNIQTTQIQRESFKKAVKAGLKIGFGTDSGVYPHGLNARQFRYMVHYGQTPMMAIQSATLSNAKLLRLDKELGSISPGKLADIIAVEGDVLADITRLEHVAKVMKGGLLVKD